MAVGTARGQGTAPAPRQTQKEELSALGRTEARHPAGFAGIRARGTAAGPSQAHPEVAGVAPDVEDKVIGLQIEQPLGPRGHRVTLGLVDHLLLHCDRHVAKLEGPEGTGRGVWSGHAALPGGGGSMAGRGQASHLSMLTAANCSPMSSSMLRVVWPAFPRRYTQCTFWLRRATPM